MKDKKTLFYVQKILGKWNQLFIYLFNKIYLVFSEGWLCDNCEKENIMNDNY